MNKRFLKVFGIVIAALIAVMTIATPVLADNPNAVVVIDEPTVTDTTQGNVATVSGKVTITAEASSNDRLGWVEAFGAAVYSISDPDGNDVTGGSQSMFSADSGRNANANASFVYSWSDSITLEKVGEYTVNQAGLAEALRGWFIIPLAFDFDYASLVWKFISTARPPALNPSHPEWWFGPKYFALMVGSRVEGYKWTNPETHELPAIEQRGNSCYDVIKVVIPEGTMVAGGIALRVGILPTGSLFFNLWGSDGNTDPVYFSQPVTIMRLVDGEWTEYYTFTEITNDCAVRFTETGEPYIVSYK